MNWIWFADESIDMNLLLFFLLNWFGSISRFYRIYSKMAHNHATSLQFEALLFLIRGNKMPGTTSVNRIEPTRVR